MPSENTKKILEDLKRAGLDTSSIENQIAINPILDKKSDSILGAGILRQSDYTRYMQETQAKEKELNQKVQELATLHDAAKTTTLPKEALETIEKLEAALLDTGIYDEESIKNVSYIGKRSLVAKQPETNNPPPAPTNNNPPVKELEMPNQNNIDMSNYIDADTFEKASANLVMGNAIVNAKVTAAIRKAEKLGAEVDDKMIESFHSNWMQGVQSGKNIDAIIDETFGISKLEATKREADFQNQLKEAEARGRAEALKENPHASRNRFSSGRHMILDRKSSNPRNTPTSEGNSETPNNPPPPNPENVNKPGHINGVPIYQTRGTREDRLQRAGDFFLQVEEKLADDITYVP